MRNKGFTLIELLVVISIIGLLSSVVLAAVQEAKEKAAWRAFDSEVNSIKTAMQLYLTVYDEWPADLATTLPAESPVSWGDEMNDVLVALNSVGLYPETVLTDPTGYSQYYVYMGSKIGTDFYGDPREDEYIECGSEDSESFWGIYGYIGQGIGDEVINKSSVMLPLFHSGTVGSSLDDYFCTSIK